MHDYSRLYFNWLGNGWTIQLKVCVPSVALDNNNLESRRNTTSWERSLAIQQEHLQLQPAVMGGLTLDLDVQYELKLQTQKERPQRWGPGSAGVQACAALCYFEECRGDPGTTKHFWVFT